MDKDEQKNDRANQTMYWTRSVPSCSTRDECLQVMDQIGEDVPGEDISEQGLIDEELASIDLHFDDEMQALLLLSSLLESWETLVVSLSNSAQNGKLTVSTVKDALFNEEVWKKEMDMIDRSRSQALISKGSKERGRGHHKSDGRGRPRSQSRDKNLDWILDSRSAYYFCKDREMFSTYATCEGLVRIMNNTTNKIVGKRTVQFRMADKRSMMLTKIRHVPKLQKNLISIRMLDSMGCSIIAKGGILRISKGNKEMLRGRKTRGLYRLEGSVQTGRAVVRHESSDIRRKNGQGKQQVHKGTQSKHRDT
ncbi:hypothetical protein Acr_00g0042200 [Actinidia rufa]|uniref:Retrovirus-related Pol polyprotein from transposon TNT 1-94-like beta-barrel domain-containing protein n=1 Tax=Actinidia rufa TaxID=165716 RepID=A0A7J0DIA5_9ERIC|nr:hypothetical protein Acr_00g0042200 [Actinidia rufa]